MKIRTALTVAAVSTGLSAGSTATAPPSNAAAVPSVDMARVLTAAQIEPTCGQSSTLDDNASTSLVQRALAAKGYPTASDGWYGNGTTSAFASWQQKLGYSGINANGLLGASSLSKLGSGRFTISHPVTLGSRTDNYGGKRVNTRTRHMLQAADDKLPRWNFHLIQGSYNPGGVSASAGTHDGGGVVDVSVAGLSSTQQWEQVKALRSVGFAAWLRTPAQGFDYHIHAVAVGDPDLWQTNGGHIARDQVCDYYQGRDGLAGHAADNTPSSYRAPFTWWEKYKGI